MKSTILLIDDDPIDIKSLQCLLESWDYDVIAARSGKEALVKLATDPVDIIVSDLRMPNMSGEDVVRAVGQTHAGLPVVLITGHGDIRSAVQAMKLGAFDYVIKPPDEEEFKMTVARAIEHSLLRKENACLRADLGADGMYVERLLGQSPAISEVIDLIARVAKTDSTVLITGETGTGKELAARTLHYHSHRAGRPLIAVNCASLNPNLIESELFGHEKGAFTGAVASRRGRFEEADGGTLFLDEISEISLESQAKLLRVLQEGEVERLGSNQKFRVNVRIVASTNRLMDAEIKAGRFREDLFYRLNVIPIRLPPLRERPEDIGILADHFADIFSKRYRTTAVTITPDTHRCLARCEWRGNVRELQHAVERAVVLSQNTQLQPTDFQFEDIRPASSPTDGTLQAFLDQQTREHVLSVLRRTRWHKQHAAALLGIDRATLYRLMKKHQIEADESLKDR
jgi:two-component system response regulator HydG